MQDLFFVGLFVVALAIGWFLGRREAIRVGVMLNPHPSALDKQYFIGLNYLLNEQPDEAIETFVRALEVNPETVETHIAIGKLFRQRGDLERAIRIHQNLLARPNLSREQGDRVQLELARDYLAVGLGQRAERLLDELIGDSALRAEALADRVRLCERERNWQQAIDYGRLLSREQPGSAVALAHYHCELASSQIRRHESAQARRSLHQALDCDAHCGRAILMLAELEFEQQALIESRRWLLRLADTDAALVPLALPLVRRLAATGQLDVIEYLSRITAGESPPVALVLARAEELRRQQGDPAASELVLAHLRKTPSAGRSVVHD